MVRDCSRLFATASRLFATVRDCFATVRDCSRLFATTHCIAKDAGISEIMHPDKRKCTLQIQSSSLWQISSFAHAYLMFSAIPHAECRQALPASQGRGRTRSLGLGMLPDTKVKGKAKQTQTRNASTKRAHKHTTRHTHTHTNDHTQPTIHTTKRN